MMFEGWRADQAFHLFHLAEGLAKLAAPQNAEQGQIALDH